MRKICLCAVLLCVTLWANPAGAQVQAPPHELVLQPEPSQSGADIRLGGNFHTVEGSFTFKRGVIRYHPASGTAGGEIVFDATSGKTGNASRDAKMHKDVIESRRYTEIVFRPQGAEGTLAIPGESTLQVHGLFMIHGDEHEITMPVQVSIRGGSWTAKAAFTIPYAKWGMKNPSKLFLRVDNEVKVQFHAAGSLTQ